jgi:hypothetical protein
VDLAGRRAAGRATKGRSKQIRTNIDVIDHDAVRYPYRKES